MLACGFTAVEKSPMYVAIIIILISRYRKIIQTEKIGKMESCNDNYNGNYCAEVAFCDIVGTLLFTTRVFKGR